MCAAMPNPSDEKIARVVATCLSHAADAERPFLQVADLLTLLKIGTGWTDDEIDEVRSRILLDLMKVKDDADDIERN
jgi:hypothetical protein